MPAVSTALALVLAMSPAHARAAPAPAPKAKSNAKSDAKAQKPPAALQEVVVTGLKQMLMSSQAIKRFSPQIVDAVTAEDIGALPDRSVAAALSRIPGVEVERTDNNRDPARLTDSGGNVFIRGLSWVKSELDGEEIFSANDGRQVSFEDISPDLLSAIKVYKSPTADQIEGGIGGVVDMETRKPLTSRHNLTAFSVDYNYGDMIKQWFPTFNALWSNYWDTSIGRVGVLLSGTYAKDGNRTDSIQLGDYASQILPQAEGGMPAGSTVYVPNSMGWRRLDWHQNRTDLDGVFQWQSPNDDWLFTAHAFQTRDNPKNLEYAEGDYGAYLGAVNSAAPTPPTADYTSIDKSGVVTGGKVWITPQLDTRYEIDHHSTEFFTTSLRWSPNDRFSLSDDLQYVKSHADMVSLTAFTQVGQQNGNALAATASGGTYLTFNTASNSPTMVLSQNPNEMSNPADYWWAAAMDHLESNDAHQWADRIDGTLKFDDSDWLKAFRFGARFEDRHAITRETNWNWNLLSHQYWGGGPPVFLTQTPGWASGLQTFNDFMRGSVPHPGVGYFPSARLVENGTAYAYSILKNTESAGWGWVPNTTNWSNYSPASGDNPANGVNDQAQHTYAAYAEIDFKDHHMPIIGPMDGNVGLRVVRTVDAPAMGRLIIAGIQNPLPAATCLASYTQAQCQVMFNAEKFVGAGGTVPYTFRANRYTNFLPSFNVRFLLTHDLQWRIAASESIARPSFDQLIPFATIGYNFQAGKPLPGTAGLTTGTAGNPELKPIRSTNVDTSLEWYFAPAGDLTFDIFYKSISNYIFAADNPVTLTRNGVTQKFDVMQYVNGSHGSVRGFELAYHQFYNFLPPLLQGFGLQGNLTFVDNSGGQNNVQNAFDTNQVAGAANPNLPMEGMSRWSYNAALMYQNHRIEGRLAWNWRERYLLTTSAANLNRPVWMENYGQLDGEIFYDVTDYLKVGIQGTNLLDAQTYLDVSRVGQHLDPGPASGVGLAPRYSWTATDRTIAVAIRMQF